jgi:hypothetical protein
VLQHFQLDMKARHVVEYIDVMAGADEVFLRCSTPAAAEELVSSVPWKQVEILKGKLDICGSLHHSTIHTENPTRCNSVSKFIIPYLCEA